MRKRSGAIHSQTQQQFIQLAQKSLQKNGLFYDQKLYSQLKSQTNLLKKDPLVHSNPFAQFDFDQHKEYQKDERELNQRTKKDQQSNIKYVVICDQVGALVELLSGQLGNQNERQFDLVVRKIPRRNGQELIVKYWIIQSKIFDSPLAQIYIGSADKVYWASNNQPKLKNVQKLNITEILGIIKQQQHKYFLL